MSVLFLGDIHGQFNVLDEIHQRGFAGAGDTVIQVGDFGVSKKFLNPQYISQLFNLPYRLLFIDGNHDDYDVIRSWGSDPIIEITNNVFFVSRGHVMEIEGQLYGFMGGADSVDKNMRYVTDGPNRDWFWEERITDADMQRLRDNVNNRRLDYLITHAPPMKVIQQSFPPLNKYMWGLDLGWIDESALQVDRLMFGLYPRKIVSGHMHKKVIYSYPVGADERCEVRILAIDEVANF